MLTHTKLWIVCISSSFAHTRVIFCVNILFKWKKNINSFKMVKSREKNVTRTTMKRNISLAYRKSSRQILVLTRRTRSLNPTFYVPFGWWVKELWVFIGWIKKLDHVFSIWKVFRNQFNKWKFQIRRQIIISIISIT